MNETEQLVRDAAEATAAALPALMDADAPVPGAAALGGDSDQGLYLIGLIGGKDVGKSALVNALVGLAITEPTSHGPGTEMAIAYVHQDRADELSELLDRQVPGRFRIVRHNLDRLSRQVLLDLPDIDSHFAAHVEVTRRMLRHMLYPLWVQSVEKYADAQPQALLAQVAAGNDSANFIFCLNKADQANEEAAALRDDYARRVAKTLKLPAPPRVYLLSALNAAKFDLPDLAKRLGTDRPAAAVRQSKDLALRQRDRTLLRWLDGQDLSGRAERLGRLHDEAAEVVSERIGVPLLEIAVPRMLDNAAYRAVMTDGVLAIRAGRWPLVGIIHTLLLPLRFVVRQNTTEAVSLQSGAEAVVDAGLSGGRDGVAATVQSTFAQLNQSHPSMANLYARMKLWEPMQAELAEGRLRMELADTIRRQRQAVTERVSGRTGFIAPLLRGMLTYGAVLWFPIIQPVLYAWLHGTTTLKTLHDIGLLAVQTFNAAALLTNAVFLVVWFLLIWLWLRWNTRRKVDRLLARWRTAAQPDPSLNLGTRTLEWLDELLAPIRQQRDQLQSLAKRAEAIKAEVA